MTETLTREETPTAFDTAAKELFAQRLLDIANGSAVALMISVGHRTRLFDRMKEIGAATSREIAAAAVLEERYVREWLGAMVTGGVVLYDAGTGRYTLPAEHAAHLTRGAAPENLATIFQFCSLLGSVEDRIVHCFRNGGGVPYEAYPRFQEVMAEESAQTVLPALADTILPLAPGLVERLEQGIDVLDVGCGAGRAMNLLAQRFPKSRFTGWDISQEGIATARRQAALQGSTNVRFDVRDLERVDAENEYDLITAFDSIHDQAQPAKVLDNVQAALRPGGVFLMQDINGSGHVERDVEHPIGAFLYTISCMHCMTVSLACDGAGLGAMWGRAKAEEMLGEAGFTKVDVHALPHDFMNLYYIARHV